MSQPGQCLSLCYSKSVERPLSAVAAPDLELSVANDFHFDIIRVVVWTKLPAFCYRQSREENDIFFDIANIDQPPLIPCLIIGEPVDNGLFCIEHFQNQALTAALRIKPVRRVAWLHGNGMGVWAGTQGKQQPGNKKKNQAASCRQNLECHLPGETAHTSTFCFQIVQASQHKCSQE